jgi:hypothetical protein
MKGTGVEMKKLLASIAIGGLALALPVFGSTAQAATGSCTFPSGYGWAGTVCSGNHRTDLPVTSANWPYNGTLFGPCAGAWSQSNVYWNPNTTFPLWQYFSADAC